MLNQKTKTTNKKFYNKWLYKVTLKIQGGPIFRNKDFDKIKNYCLSLKENEYNYSLASKVYNNREEILNFLDFFKNQKENNIDFTLRIEQSTVDYYTNDKASYDNISNRFEEKIIHRFEPNENSVISENSIICKKYPHDRYQYRVYLLPHKMAKDLESKQNYVQWLKKQGDKVTCTKAVEEWFIKTDWNWDRRYILVEDESMLLMLKLRNSDVVGRIYKFVISDK